jgi:hypothetical protein
LLIAIYLLSTAEDEEEQATALAVVHLALAQKRKEQSERPNLGKYGPRGPYDRVKSVDFFALLLNEFTDRQFKNWLR